MPMNDALVAVDLSRLTTDQLGQAYVEMLRSSVNSPERAALHAEWTRRPKADRLAALRRCRDQAASERDVVVNIQIAV